ncbi:serine hydrolase domain-containing protein [Phenylobacterium conjunctum]|uniref:Serine hydrolase domain-containing protein n=1 Tax=Phenylobacterium conjunctum TaxID=1298959 RepID=A0ABW3T2U8_9CAUL
MRRLLFAALVATPLLTTSAQAAEDAHVRALAAGYKANFLCSDLFNAGLTEAQATEWDLEGIYPEYQTVIRTLEAKVDRQARTVSVAFDPKLPPRLAAWRPGLGCTSLPIGAGPDAIAALPKLKIKPPSAVGKAWPDGDEGATATPLAPVAAALDQAISKAFDPAVQGEGPRTTAVLVIRDGKIVAERYVEGFGPQTPQRTWSAAKSMTATMVGRAVQLGKLKVDTPARVPEWPAGDPRRAITLANLMHMNSGLWTDGPGNRTDELYAGGALVTQTATVMPLEAAPGTRFRYANNDTLLAMRSVRAAMGDGEAALNFPFQEVFWKIGMLHTVPETDWQGNYILSSQVWTTARDLGRLGLLYMNDGVWNGERLLPQGWSKFVATPAQTQPDSGPGYGAFFWLYGAAQGLPADTYVMNGNRGQYVFIVPSKNTIIVRRGFDKAGAKAFDLAGFAREVLAALEAR